MNLKSNNSNIMSIKLTQADWEKLNRLKKTNDIDSEEEAALVKVWTRKYTKDTKTITEKQWKNNKRRKVVPTPTKKEIKKMKENAKNKAQIKRENTRSKIKEDKKEYKRIKYRTFKKSHEGFSTEEEHFTIPIDKLLNNPNRFLPSKNENTSEVIYFDLKFENGTKLNKNIEVNSRSELWEKMENVMQSQTLAERGPVKDVILKYYPTKIPTGKGNLKPLPRNYEEAKRKKAIIKIKNNNEFCLDMCMHLATFLHLKKSPVGSPNNNKWKNNCKMDRLSKNGKMLRETMHKLHNQISMEGGIGLDQLHFYENYFQVNIHVYQLLGLTQPETIYPFTNDLSVLKYEQGVYLLYNETHYDLITNVQAFLGKDYRPVCCKCRSSQCEYADKNYYDKNNHKKTGEFYKWTKCEKCNRSFHSPECYEFHLQKGKKEKSTCEKFHRCLKCNQDYDTDKQHTCGFDECKNCKEYCDLAQHKCFIQQKNPNRHHPLNRIIHFDFETYCSRNCPHCYNEIDIKNNVCNFCKTNIEIKQEHQVNLIISQYSDGTEILHTKLEDFINWCFESKHKGYLFIAHNGSGYDFKLILDYLLNNGQTAPNVTMMSSRVMGMRIGDKHNIRFMDSYLHLSNPLRDLPGIFGIEDSKGDFPHKFNTKENWNYIGPLPSKKYYGYSNMKADRQKDFDKWYNSAQTDNWNFQEEFRKYCSADVTVQRKCFTKYCELIQLLTDKQFCPTGYLTIASLAQGIEIYFHMPKNSIAVEIQKKGKKQSKIGNEWIAFLSRYQNKLPNAIKEYKVPDVGHVDLYDPDSNTVYEFLGDYYHGNPNNSVTSGTRYNFSTKTTFAKLYEDTKKRLDKIKDKNYNLVTMWELDWKKERKLYPQFLDWWKSYSPLVLRDGFFGGRTDIKKLYHSVIENPSTKIRAYDFTSLYPYVNKYCLYPVGHPIKMTNIKDTDISQYFGIIKCKVKCPKHLEMGLLPVRDEQLNKLIFPLYDELVGTWCTIELNDALQEGYEILQIYEVHHWEEKSNEIFKGYIDTFMKVKQESSGWPDWCKTDEDQSKYIYDYFQKEGIQMDQANIKKNKGLRAVAKLLLNSLWGKFVEKQNKPITKFIPKNKVYQFYDIISNPYIEYSLDFVGNKQNEMAMVTFKQKEHLAKPTYKTNEIIGVFTTAYARTRLYKVFKKVGFENVIVFDTDSCYYIEKPGVNDKSLDEDDNRICKGDYLGQLTDELSEYENIHGQCIEIVATAPKTYSLLFEDGFEINKSKGFTLSVANTKLLNFQTMKHLVLQKQQMMLGNDISVDWSTGGQMFGSVNIRSENIRQMKRCEDNYKKLGLENRIEDKIFQFDYNKGEVNWETLEVYPYGYEEEEDLEWDII